MTATVTAGARTADAWRQFAGTGWRERIDVRDFIQANYTPYEGDAAFLTGPTDRTRALWQKVSALFPEERRKGVLDVDTATPSTITSHAPGCIDRDRELIVGPQTDKLGAAKYDALGIPFPLGDNPVPDRAPVARVRDRFRGHGLTAH